MNCLRCPCHAVSQSKDEPSPTDLEARFDKAVPNVGWIPENKTRILSFIREIESAAYRKGREDECDYIEKHLAAALFCDGPCKHQPLPSPRTGEPFDKK